jgi:hypothetical protein
LLRTSSKKRESTNSYYRARTTYKPSGSVLGTGVNSDENSGLYAEKGIRVIFSRSSGLIAEDVLKEARIYELLLQSPHPNIATYLGCQVDDGTIILNI